MSSKNSNTSYSLILLIILFLLLVTVKPSFAFDPLIVDVTSKSFSVVWVTSPHSSPGILMYDSNTYDRQLSPRKLKESGISILIDSNEKARSCGIMKVTVAGLESDTFYYFNPATDGKEENFKGKVKTEQNYLNKNNHGPIRSIKNGILHHIVYGKDGKSPALGVLVLAEIMQGEIALSDYPVSAWVGDNMPGDETTIVYRSGKISYKQYAAINFDHLYNKNHQPLRLCEGRNSDTSVKLTILKGSQDIYRQDIYEDDSNKVYYRESAKLPPFKTDHKGRGPVLVMVKPPFRKGMINSFALPGKVPGKDYNSEDLLDDLIAAGGNVEAILGLTEGKWKITKRESGNRLFSTYSLPDIDTHSSIENTFINNLFSDERGTKCNPYTIQEGSGYFIKIDPQASDKEIALIYELSQPPVITLKENTFHAISLPQVPAFFTTGDLFKAIENQNAIVSGIYSLVNGKWEKSERNPATGVIGHSFPVRPGESYLVSIKDINNDSHIIYKLNLFE